MKIFNSQENGNLYQIPCTYRRGSSGRAVVFSHGLSVDRHEYLGLFDFISEYTRKTAAHSVQFDFCGHGTNTQPLSIKRQFEEITCVCTALTELGVVEILIVACSFGAGPALFALNEVPNVRHAVLLCPVLDYDLMLLRGQSEWSREEFSKESLQTAYDSGKLKMTNGFEMPAAVLEEMTRVNLTEYLRRGSSKITAIVAEADTMLSASDTLRILHETNVESVITIKDMDHGYMAVGDDQGLSPESIANRDVISAVVLNRLSQS